MTRAELVLRLADLVASRVLTPAEAARLLALWGLRDMFPDITANNGPYVMRACLELFGNVVCALAVGVPLTNGANLRGSKPCHCVILSQTGFVPGATLAHHVERVVERSSEPEVIGIDARGVIALVQNVQPLWNRAKVNHPGSAMGEDGASIKSKLSIAIPRNAAEPEPTAISLQDMAQKSFLDGEFPTMAWNKAHRKTFGPPIAAVTLARERGFLSAPALAFAIGRGQSVHCDPGGIIGCEQRKLNVMIGHVASPFVTIGQAGGC